MSEVLKELPLFRGSDMSTSKHIYVLNCSYSIRYKFCEFASMNLHNIYGMIGRVR